MKLIIPGCNDIAGMVIIHKWRQVGKFHMGCMRLLTQCLLKPSEKIGEATSHRHRQQSMTLPKESRIENGNSTTK